MSPAARPRRHSHVYHVGFLLVAQFPMMAFAAALEPLRAANRLSGSTLYGWSFYSRDGRPVIASNGVEVAVHGAVGADAKLDLLLVCAGTQETQPPSVTKWLRALARTGTALGGISLGAYALADAGLLDGRRCAVHWENLAAFTDRYPRAKTMPDILAIDGDRYTCSGGTSALDLMLQLVTDQHGRTLANGVSEQFIHPRIRDTHDSQRMAVQSRIGVANERLIAAVDLMEAAADEPQSVHDIARAVGLSPRQLERLFARYLRDTPSRHYMKLRLARARALLLQTTKPILDVAVASGFTSASHFSRRYRATYGRKPSDERAGVRS
ncbi:MAG TPA: GlxA family transcriptional regulator [Casimicrobiaceae bacterium]|jgi:transcriptional regulator GlxA family with amidase domain|nr:GlxA family transcriptional regulator [Casimicrobiaceae bacterium]